MRRIYELGDTYRGQKILGRLSARKEYGKNDAKGAEDIDRYARNKRADKDDRGKLSLAYCIGQCGEAEDIEDKRMDESISRVIRQVLNEWGYDDWKTDSPANHTPDTARVEILLRISTSPSSFEKWSSGNVTNVSQPEDDVVEFELSFSDDCFLDEGYIDKDDLHSIAYDYVKSFRDNDCVWEIVDYNII